MFRRQSRHHAPGEQSRIGDHKDDDDRDELLKRQGRGGSIVFDSESGRGFGGAGTIHHIAWATPYDEHDAWRRRVVDGGVHCCLLRAT